MARTNAGGLDSHRAAAQLEDVLWLVSEGGCSLEQACRRVGVSVESVEKRIARARARDASPADDGRPL